MISGSGGHAVALATALLLNVGCVPGSPDRLVVATSLPVAERKRLETAFQSWTAGSSDERKGHSARVEWVSLRAGDDPIKLAGRANAPHIFLGSVESVAGLASASQLQPIANAGGARWYRFSRAVKAGAPERVDLAASAWNDPRGDRPTLRWAMSELASEGWREGYARLIRTAAVRERFGASYASDLTASAVDAVGIARSASDSAAAQAFLRFLCETEGASAAADAESSDVGRSDLVGSLIADLVGATLVDAQDELWAAWRTLEKVSDRERALAWLVEPPPWPPASVSRYLGREGERAMALIETLSAEVAPMPAARAWLRRSWLSPARVVDQKFLSELAEAAGGQLCREPRFRAWLREEWTAWARQRYRRVARWVGTEASRPRDQGAPTRR
jgi:hypothetical protein